MSLKNNDFFMILAGPLSRAILRKAGSAMQKECESTPVVKNRHLRVTRGGKLKCKYVVHLIAPHSAETYAERIACAFDSAEELGARSIAVPTLGAGLEKLV